MPAPARKKAKARPAPRTRDATALLKADHKLVSGLFKDFEDTNSTARKAKLARQICMELTIHATVEEEIFYPAVQKALKDHELVPEAIVEHESLKMLIASLEEVEPGDDMHDARVKVMSEYVKHHVKEEQNEIFPKARKTKLDMVELGEQILQRKEELKAELGAA
jgi:hemerythrin-like domain-containing protein